MYRAASLAAAVILCMASLPTLADPLPKTAKPINSDEITKLYSGKTTDWKISSAYFAPDGTVKGYLGKPVVKTTFKGTWKVTGNEICMEFSTPKDSGLSDCWKYWRNGKDVITLWSRHYDGSKADEANGYYKNEVAKLKAGDLVSAKYAEAGGT